MNQNLLLIKTKHSWKLVTCSVLVLAGIVQGYPKFDQAMKSDAIKQQRDQQQADVNGAKLAQLDQQVEDGKLLSKQAELAKTRIFSGAAHYVTSTVSGGAPIQLKVGQKYYGRGDVNNPIPLPPGTVVRDYFCGTGIIADDGTLQNFASAQGECVQITNQLRNAQAQTLNGEQPQ